MPYTSNDLKEAIYRGDLEEVRNITQERNAQGNPTVNVNNILDGVGRETAFQYVLRRGVGWVVNNQKPTPIKPDILFGMLEAILAVQDRNGNPTIDLNKKLYDKTHGETALEDLLIRGKNKLTPQHLRTLIYRMVNLRFTNGDRVCDCSYISDYSTPLIQAKLSC